MNRSSYELKSLPNVMEHVPIAPAIEPALQHLFATLDATAFKGTAVERTAGGVYVAINRSKLLLPTSREAATPKSHVRG